MRVRGVQPNAATYNALILAYGRAGRAKEALEVFAELEAHPVLRPSMRTYSSAIFSCGVCELWQRADEIERAVLMRRRSSCRPQTNRFASAAAPNV